MRVEAGAHPALTRLDFEGPGTRSTSLPRLNLWFPCLLLFRLEIPRPSPPAVSIYGMNGTISYNAPRKSRRSGLVYSH